MCCGEPGELQTSLSQKGVGADFPSQDAKGLSLPLNVLRWMPGVQHLGFTNVWTWKPSLSENPPYPFPFPVVGFVQLGGAAPSSWIPFIVFFAGLMGSECSCMLLEPPWRCHRKSSRP